MMLCLIGLDQDRKDLRLIAFQRARLGIPQCSTSVNAAQ
jgi:hypothetical protein